MMVMAVRYGICLLLLAGSALAQPRCMFCPNNLMTHTTFGPVGNQTNMTVGEGDKTCLSVYFEALKDQQRCDLIITNYQDLCCGSGAEPAQSPSPSVRRPTNYPSTNPSGSPEPSPFPSVSLLPTTSSAPTTSSVPTTCVPDMGSCNPGGASCCSSNFDCSVFVDNVGDAPYYLCTRFFSPGDLNERADNPNKIKTPRHIDCPDGLERGNRQFCKQFSPAGDGGGRKRGLASGVRGAKK